MKRQDYIIIFSFFLIVIYSLAGANTISDSLTPYRAYLRPGTIMKKIADGKKIQTKENLYVLVSPVDPKRLDYFLIYDKKGNPSFEVAAQDVIEIGADLQLLPNIHADVPYPPPSTLFSRDTKAYFDTQFSWHLDNLQIAPLSNLYNDDSSSVVGTRYEIRSLYLSGLPLNVGMGLNFQTALWENEIEQIKLSILSFGPLLEKTLFRDEDKYLSGIFSAEYAPIYRTSSTNTVEKFNAILFDLGLEMTWDTPFGHWALGSHYRRHNLTLTQSTNPDINTAPHELVVNSIGVMVGYKYEWDLQ